MIDVEVHEIVGDSEVEPEASFREVRPQLGRSHESHEGSLKSLSLFESVGKPVTSVPRRKIQSQIRMLVAISRKGRVTATEGVDGELRGSREYRGGDEGSMRDR